MLFEALIVLFVKVSVELSVTTVPSIAKVTLLPEALDVIPVPPSKPRVSLSRSMAIVEEPSLMSRSERPTCVST